MYCDARNFWRASDEMGVHYLKRIFGGPYWEIKFCSFLMMESADLGRGLRHERIFTESVCNEEVLFVVVGEEVSCPWGIWYISGEHRLDCLLGSMLGTNFALINTIGDVQVYAGPVDGGWDRCLIFSIPLWFLQRSLSILSYS